MNTQAVEVSRSIGAILIDTGKLAIEDVERILAAQRQGGLPFGEAALKLGLLSAQDLQFALSRQHDYPYLLPGNGEISDELVAAFEPFSEEVEGLRALRSQLLVRWFTGEVGRRALAVVSTERGEGRSYLAANLAVVFSQLGEHTLLIDADLRHPKQHALFSLHNRSGLSTLLSNRSEGDEVKHIPSFSNLSVVSSGPVPPNPQELLGRPKFAQMLDEWATQFDVILIDTPATSAFADVQTIARRARGALILARVRQTRIAELKELASTLTQSGVAVVGSVINEAVFDPKAR